MTSPNKHFPFFHLLSYDPALLYGRTKQQQVAPFRPHFVLYDKKTLKFMGFFRQHVPESRVEHHRVRYVNIFYYLEDDTITVIEPIVKVEIYGHVVRRSTSHLSVSSSPSRIVDYRRANWCDVVALRKMPPLERSTHGRILMSATMSSSTESYFTSPTAMSSRANSLRPTALKCASGNVHRRIR